MNKCYMASTVGSLIARDLIKYAQDCPLESWVKYYNFDAIPVHPNIWRQDPFLSYLSKKRKFGAGILRMPPDTCYNWHVDTDRNVGLNMLLADDNKSRCLFIDDDQSDLVFKTRELKYQPSTYYVFNVAKPHIVLNTSQPRYLFTLEFLDEDSELTFDELCTDIKG